jgi:hypothetical protein
LKEKVSAWTAKRHALLRPAQWPKGRSRQFSALRRHRQPVAGFQVSEEDKGGKEEAKKSKSNPQTKKADKNALRTRTPRK